MHGFSKLRAFVNEITIFLFRTKHEQFFSEPQMQTAPLASTKPEKLFKTELITDYKATHLHVIE